MYEELVKRLRHCGNENLPCNGCSEYSEYDECCNFDSGAATNMREAADAIEELEAQLKATQKTLLQALEIIEAEGE